MWILLLGNLIKEALAKDEQKMGLDKPGKQAPVWVKDEDVTMCMLCAVKFGLVHRKHHCRGCGRVDVYYIIVPLVKLLFQTTSVNTRVLIYLGTYFKKKIIAADSYSRRKLCSANICLFKVNNSDTRNKCEICSKLIIKTPERHH